MVWAIVVFTILAVYFLDKWENKYIKSIFDWVPAILFAYIIPAILCAVLNKDYTGHEIHEYSKLYFIPLAIVAVMSSLSFQQLKQIGWKPILVFVTGSFWIAVFPIALLFIFLNNPATKELLVAREYWMGIPPIVGGWIGGSTSQLVLKELVACPENIFLTVLVFDNILVNIWTILMFQGIKKSNLLNRILKVTDHNMPDEIDISKSRVLPPSIVSILLIASVLILNFLSNSFVLKVVILSFLGLLYSNLIPKWPTGFVLKAGSILIILVMAVLGLKLKFELIQFEPYFLFFLIIWLISHFVIMLLTAKMLNLNTAWVPIASMANVGGVATAPAVTAAYEKKWMPHAIILAILSMATGTFWGMLTIYMLQIVIN